MTSVSGAKVKLDSGDSTDVTAAGVIVKVLVLTMVTAEADMMGNTVSSTVLVT